MRTLFFILLFTGCCLFSFAQGLSNLWYLGYANDYSPPYGGSDINFINNQADTSYHQRPMGFDLTNANISDSAGNMLFYTNGAYICNAADDTMLNGTGLNPSSYTDDSLTQYFGVGVSQADIIIPKPGNSFCYYLFHHTYYYGYAYLPILYKSIVNMSLDGGLGGIELKNDTLLEGQLSRSGFIACKHANGRDWWLINHLQNNNTYLKWLVSAAGIASPDTQSIGKVTSFSNTGRGQLKFSMQGTKFAYYDVTGDLDIMDFDRCSGMFSNLVHDSINDSAYVGGCAFSPNGQILYVSSDKYVYQYDLTAANIPASRITVAVYDGFVAPVAPFYTTFYQ
ncbi:MAG: putative adhesin, partial [Bacteroidota bacterium]